MSLTPFDQAVEDQAEADRAEDKALAAYYAYKVAIGGTNLTDEIYMTLWTKVVEARDNTRKAGHVVAQLWED